MDRSFAPRLGFLGACVAAGILLAIVAHAAVPAAIPSQSGRVSGVDLASGTQADLAGASPTPSRASEITSATHVFGAAGFQLILPGGWFVDEESADAVVISGPGRQLVVQVGDTSGSLPSSCLKVYRIGFEECSGVVIETLDDFENAFCDGCPKPSLSDSLAGEEARRVRISGYEYILALHDGRPYIVRFHRAVSFQPGAPKEPSWESILHTLQFFDAPAAGTPTTYGPLVWYTNQEDGYELLLPEAWAEGASPISQRGETYDGVRKFGVAIPSLAYQGLTISIGQPGGYVHARCGVAACDSIHAVTLDELAEVLISNSPSAPASWTESYGDLTLGGEPGGWERAANRSDCLGCPWAMYHAFAIHHGRPVVLAFDDWNLRFNRLGPNTKALINQMVASFRFLD